MVVPAQDVAPSASNMASRFERLSIGEAGHAKIAYTDDRLFVLLFPWLFPDGTGAPMYSNRYQLTFKEHCKMLLMHPVDRRFGQSISFVFFVADLLEKVAIHGHSQRTVKASQLGNLTVEDIHLPGTTIIREDITSAIPHTVRSGFSYKRQRFLNLMAMFRAYVRSLGPNDEPWRDPVMFTHHFKHMWSELFRKRILKTFGNSIGGICGVGVICM
ncbi:hypothetical protein BC941DRAFT_457246 [Chlamydoabsidia padenii]|nr:hypothetical protein BC941DRAFT_457246 [Chlamydoabsidia padenii]